MALWGNLDAKGSGGTVSLNYSTLLVTGTGTTFGQVGAAATGDIIRFGEVNGVYFGDAIIVGVTSARQLSIASTSNLSGVAIASTTFSISQLPKFTTLDSHYKAGVSTTYDALVYGVSTVEMASKSSTTFDLNHSGWVGVTTYLDWEGNVRVKSEVLVAMSSIEGDAADDSVLPDGVITFIVNPQNLTGVGSTATVTFSADTTVVPSTATVTYRWQTSSNNTSYTNVTNGGVYSGATTKTLSIANTNKSLNGHFYRLTAASGDASAISGIASITFA